MTLSDYGSSLRDYNLFEEVRRGFRFNQNHKEELFFGFFLRVVNAVAAVITSGVIVIVIGFFNGWDFSNNVIVVFATVASICIVFGEHVRSRVYERVQSSRAGRELPAADFGAIHQMAELSPLSIDGATFLRIYRRKASLKRTVDIILSATAIFLLWPICIVIAFAIKFDSPGPVLVRAKIAGPCGSSFKVWKFRTEFVSEYENLHVGVLTSVGLFLRSTGIDEIPCLLNVISGQMSVVGPKREVADVIYQGLNEQVQCEVYEFIKPGLIGHASTLFTAIHYQIDEKIVSEVHPEYGYGYGALAAKSVLRWSIAVYLAEILQSLVTRTARIVV